MGMGKERIGKGNGNEKGDGRRNENQNRNETVVPPREERLPAAYNGQLEALKGARSPLRSSSEGHTAKGFLGPFKIALLMHT